MDARRRMRGQGAKGTRSKHAAAGVWRANRRAKCDIVAKKEIGAAKLETPGRPARPVSCSTPGAQRPPGGPSARVGVVEAGGLEARPRLRASKERGPSKRIRGGDARSLVDGRASPHGTPRPAPPPAGRPPMVPADDAAVMPLAQRRTCRDSTGEVERVLWMCEGRPRGSGLCMWNYLPSRGAGGGASLPIIWSSAQQSRRRWRWRGGGAANAGVGGGDGGKHGATTGDGGGGCDGDGGSTG